MRSVIPISQCAWCGRFRNNNVWVQEPPAWLGAAISHSICPDCKVQYFPAFLHRKEGQLGPPVSGSEASPARFRCAT